MSDEIDGVDEKYTLYTPLNSFLSSTTTWNGRTIDHNPSSASPLLSDPLPFPHLPDPYSSAVPFTKKAEILDLHEENSEAVPENESDWHLSSPTPLHKQSVPETASLEEILSSTGFEYDTQLMHVLECKSLWKRITHGAKKGVKETVNFVKSTAEKTVKFVKEHKKEVLIGTAAIAGGIGLGIFAGEYIVEAATMLGTAIFGSKKREEEEKYE